MTVNSEQPTYATVTITYSKVRSRAELPTLDDAQIEAHVKDMVAAIEARMVADLKYGLQHSAPSRRSSEDRCPRGYFTGPIA